MRNWYPKVQRKLAQVSYECVVDSPIGKIGIAFLQGRVARVDFLLSSVALVVSKTILGNLVADKVTKYFYQPHSSFNFLPLHICGTPLQKKVWRLLCKIPLGSTVTYGGLARRLGTSPRVIGAACRSNPLPIIIPCHRVVAANGLGGYCGSDSRCVANKKWLLAHESH